LTQVLLNLGMNAIHAMGYEGALAIRATANAEQVEITVRDSGPGIADEVRSRMFDAGFTTRAGSAGLGLAVSKRIIEEHNGTITATAGQPGAMLLIRLPRLKEESHA
jgi:signal transduction histidine kinase